MTDWFGDIFGWSNDKYSRHQCSIKNPSKTVCFHPVRSYSDAAYVFVFIIFRWSKNVTNMSRMSYSHRHIESKSNTYHIYTSSI